MAYRETDTITAEAEAIDAIDAAIEESIARSREESRRTLWRKRLIGWAGRLVFLGGLVTLGIAWAVDSEWGSLVAVMIIFASPGVGLMGLGGSLSTHADGDKAPINNHLIGR